MTHEDGFFVGVRGARIYYQSWLPDAEPRAVILISHGLAEHSSRYMNVVNRFDSLDNIGHGRSGGRRVYVKQFTDFTDVLSNYLAMIEKWQPGKPIFLWGHSMGALISAVFLLDHQSAFAGAILSGPSVVVPKNVHSMGALISAVFLLDHQSAFAGAILSGPSVVVPKNVSRSTIAIARILSALAPKVRLMALDAEGVSRDSEVVRAYVDDPLVYTGKTTARLAYELVKAMQRVTTEASRITLPMMILQGGADRLVDPDGARILYDTIGSSDKTLKVYDGLYHEVYNEPEHDLVLGDVEAWLEKHTSSLVLGDVEAWLEKHTSSPS